MIAHGSQGAALRRLLGRILRARRSAAQWLDRILFSNLGRCAQCMRMSFGVSLVCLSLLILVFAANARESTIAAVACAAIASTLWSAAHLSAYLLRGPAPVTACRSCAEKARAFQRGQRLRRLKNFFLRPWGHQVPMKLRAPCRTCYRKTPIEAMGQARAADAALRYVAEQSPEFQRLLPQLASPEPTDTWQADMLHYFLYALSPDSAERDAHLLFIADWETDRPKAAVLVRPDGTSIAL